MQCIHRQLYLYLTNALGYFFLVWSVLNRLVNIRFHTIMANYNNTYKYPLLGCKLTESELFHQAEKTHRHIRLKELLKQNSTDANLVVM